MSLAKSTVQVSIVSQLGQGFSAAFQTADTRLKNLGKTADATSKAMGNIDAYRRQQEAVKQAGYQWQAAKVKADAFRQAISAQGAPTKQQTREMARLDAAVGRASEQFGRQRDRLGEMSRELQRAGVHTGKLGTEYDKLKAKLQTTQTQHERLEKSLQRQQRIVSAMSATWRGIAGTAAGVTAAGAVLAMPTRKAMTYDEQLSYMADTAAAGEGPDAYRAAKAQISDAINAALKAGGGKREDAAAALNTLIASGKFGFQDALKQMGDVSRTAFASGASADDIAKTAIALKNFGIQDPGSQFDKLLRAGQLGNFELRDMAKSLPNQLALARAAGMSGTQGLTDLLAFNQVAMKTAGTPEEAGNNVVNLLQKFTSREFAKSMADNVTLRKGDPFVANKKGQPQFDWSGYAINMREKGVSQIDAFAMLMEREMSGDKRYQKLQKRIASAGSDAERRTTLEAMASIAEGSKLGEFIADRQALMGALASLYGRQEMIGLREGIGNSAGAVQQSSANIRGETWAKAVDAANSLNRANEQAYNELAGPLGRVLEAANGMAEKFPGVTAGAYAAGTALSALAAGIAATGLWQLLTKGGAAAAGAGAAGAAAAGAGSGAGILGTLIRGGAPLGLAVGLANSTSPQEDAILAKSAQAERAKRAELTQLYGRETLEKAFEAKAPWYQFGTVDTARPDRLEGWVKDYVAEQGAGASAAAADAAKAASEAATAAQNRPNVVQHNSYSVVLQAPPQAGALEFTEMFNKALRERERQSAADLRGSFLGQPQY